MLWSFLKPSTFGLLCLTALLSFAPAQLAGRAQSTKSTARSARAVIQTAPPTEAPTPLEFREFFAADARELKPSAKLLALHGRRVRMVGFMAQMEEPPRGAFYLCPRPVYADESGGGTADLPPAHVRVMVRSAREQAVAFVARPIEVTGILEVGNAIEPDGTVSAVRLLLDPPDHKPAPTRRAKSLRNPASRKGASTTTHQH